MAGQAQKPHEWSDAFNQQAAMVASAQSTFVRAWTAAAQNYAEGMVALTKEASDFLSRRLDHDATFGQSVCDCTSWAELAEAQQDWMRTAAEAYFNEAQKFTGMGLSMAMNETGHARGGESRKPAAAGTAASKAK